MNREYRYAESYPINTKSGISYFSPYKSSQQAQYSQYSQYPQSNQYQPAQSYVHIPSTNNGSRIANLNERLSQETEMIKMRNSMMRKNFDTKSSSSHRSRSRGSRDSRGSSRERIQVQPAFSYKSSVSSLSNSRTSENILNQPIIRYNQTSSMREPILNVQSRQHESPTFKRVQPGHEVPLYGNQPILTSNSYPNTQNNAKSIFKEFKSGEKNMRSKTSNDDSDLEEFLDMDFHKKGPSSEEIRSYSETEPVSPVTPIYPNYHDDSVDDFEPEFGTATAKSYSRSQSGILNKVKNMLKKVDSDGKLITALLVGIGVILVILQTIK